MIGLKEFFQIFKDAGTGFSEEALARFHRSVKKSVALSHTGRRGLPLLLKLDREKQWPILREIDDPTLILYRGADQKLLTDFIQTIKAQKESNSWLTLQESVQKRAELYEEIFDFSSQERASSARAGRKFENILLKRDKRRQLMIGGGVAAAGIMGTGVFFWLRGREKK